MTTAEIKDRIAELKAKTTKLKALVYDAWRKQNPDAAGGMILSPNALKGAKDAINDKYGTGSVIY